MLTVEAINELIGVNESYKASFRLMDILKNQDEREHLFDSFIKLEPDLNYDSLSDYFQSEHGDRKNNMQDFTPDGVTELAVSILEPSGSMLDMCAGTGALTIKAWTKSPDMIFVCEEFSERAFPFLLFNLAIRNIEGWALRGNSLTREFAGSYKLEKGERYSQIISQEYEPQKVDTAILNPPYSQSWEHAPELITEPRFAPFGALAPKSKADYAFVLTALHQVKEGGRLLAILPHGVLFRGSAEETIRRNLIDMGYLDGLVGIAGNVFINTGIPTVMLILSRENADSIVIDAVDEVERVGKYNELKPKHIEKVSATYRHRLEVDKLSKVVTAKEIRENDYNLNLPRYVDKYEPEPVESLENLFHELLEIDEDIQDARTELASMMRKLTAEDPDDGAYLGRIADHMMAQVGRVLPGERPQVIRRPRVIEYCPEPEKEEKQAVDTMPPPEEGDQLSLYDL